MSKRYIGERHYVRKKDTYKVVRMHCIGTGCSSRKKSQTIRLQYSLCRAKIGTKYEHGRHQEAIYLTIASKGMKLTYHGKYARTPSWSCAHQCAISARNFRPHRQGNSLVEIFGFSRLFVDLTKIYLNSVKLCENFKIRKFRNFGATKWPKF